MSNTFDVFEMILKPKWTQPEIIRDEAELLEIEIERQADIAYEQLCLTSYDVKEG